MLDKLKALLAPRDHAATIKLGWKADRWLGDEALDVALAQLREENYNAWRVSGNPDAQARAWLMAHVIDQFVANLESLKVAGEVAEKLEEQEQKKAARKRPTASPRNAGL